MGTETPRAIFPPAGNPRWEVSTELVVDDAIVRALVDDGFFAVVVEEKEEDDELRSAASGKMRNA